jgi:hypothetical protein
MIRKAFLLGPSDLVPTAERLATDVEPWATRVVCNYADYMAAGIGGEMCKIPAPRSQVGSVAAFERFTHPLSPERMDEVADDFRRNTHIIELVPARDEVCPRGEVRIAVDHG